MDLFVERSGKGEPLVVLPSFSLDHSAMGCAVEPVFDNIDASWQRLYVDLPGTGKSPASEPRSDVVLEQLTATIEAHLGSRRFAVLGWSYGGYLAAGLARRLPDQVSGLMMVCTGFKIMPADRNLSGVLDSIQEPGWLADAPGDLHDHLRQATGHQTAAAGGRIASALRANGPTDEGFLESLRADGFALSDEDAATLLDAPTCLLAGRRDRVIGYAGLLAGLGHLPQGDFIALSDAGHYLPLEQPRAFAQAVRAWLCRVPRDDEQPSCR